MSDLENKEAKKIYGVNDFKKDIDPIVSGEDFATNSVEQNLANIYRVFQQNYDASDQETKEYFSDVSDKIKKAYGYEHDTKWFNEVPKPQILDTDDEDTKEQKWEDWKELSKDFIAKAGPEYYLHKREADSLIENYGNYNRRLIAGEDTGYFKDKFNRFAETASAGITDVVGAKGASNWLRNFFEENPSMDEDTSSQVASGLGGQAIFLGGLAASAVTLNPVPAALAGFANSAKIGVESYKAAYDQVYENTGSTSSAHTAGWQSALSQAAIEQASSFLVAKKVAQPFLAGLNTANKAKYFGMMSAAGSLGLTGLTEAVEEGGQSLTNDLVVNNQIKGEFTLDENSLANAGQSMKIGGLTGVILGVPGAARSYSQAQQMIEDQALKLKTQANKVDSNLREEGNRRRGLASEEEAFVAADRESGLETAENKRLSKSDPADAVDIANRIKSKSDIGLKSVDNKSGLALPGPAGNLKRLPNFVLEPHKQVELAAKLQSFEADVNNEEIELKGYNIKNIPSDLPRLLGLKAEPTAEGVKFKKPSLLEPDLTFDKDIPITEDLLRAKQQSLRMQLLKTPQSAEVLAGELIANTEVINKGTEDLKSLAKRKDSEKNKAKIEEGTKLLRKARERGAELREQIAEENANYFYTRKRKAIQQEILKIEEAIQNKTYAQSNTETNQDNSDSPVGPEINLEGDTPIFSKIGDIYKTVPVENLDPYSLTVNKDIVQFKGNSDKTTGKSDSSQYTGDFDFLNHEPISVFKKKSGEMEVATGRNRTEGAKETISKVKSQGYNKPLKIQAKVYNESEGFTANDMQAIDLISNIRQGAGKIEDYVKVFSKNRKVFTEEEAARMGLLSEQRDKDGNLKKTLGAKGFVIGTKGSQDLIDRVINGDIKADHAYEIASSAPLNDKLQSVGIKRAKEGDSAAEVGGYLEALKESGLNSEEAPQEQGALPGIAVNNPSDDIYWQNKAATNLSKQYQERANAVKGAAKNPEIAKEFGVTVTNPEAVAAKAAEFQQNAQLLQPKNWRKNPEVRDMVLKQAKTLRDLYNSNKGKSILIDGKTDKDSFKSKKLDKDLLALKDYWVNSIEGMKEINPLVISRSEVLDGTLNEILGTTEDFKSSIKDSPDSKQVQGGMAFITNSGQPVIVVNDTLNENLSRDAIVLSHEFGHHIYNKLWTEAPSDVKESVVNDWRSGLVGTTNQRVGTIAKRLLGPYSAFLNDRRQMKSLSPEELAYVTSFEEFFADKVSKYLTDPTKKPTTQAQSLYQKIAYKLGKIWESLKGFMVDPPALEKWLDDMFVPARPAADIQASDAFKKPIGGQFETGISKPSKFAERVASNKNEDPEIREALKGKEYQEESSKDKLAYYAARLNDNIAIDINRIMDSSNDLPGSERVAYATAVTEELNKRIYKAKQKSDSLAEVEEYIDQQTLLHNFIAEQGVKAGQWVESYKLYNRMSPEAKVATFERELKSATKDENAKLTPEQSQKIKDYDRLIKDENLDGIAASELYTQLIQDISKDMKVSASDMASYMWYGNILSGLSTQGVNAFGSIQNLMFRGMSVAAADPKFAKFFFGGLAKGLQRGKANFSYVMQGGMPAKGVSKVTLEAIKSLRAPEIAILDTDNGFKKAGKAVLNTYLKALEKYPLRLMSATDAFFYSTGKELMANYATAKALSKNAGLSGTELANAVYKEMYGSETFLEDSMSQAKKEFAQAGLTSNKSKVLLRAFEILDNQRSSFAQQESQRFGELVTYNYKPEGTLGHVAESINDFINKLPTGGKAVARALMPFVNVVSNVLSQQLDATPIGLWRAAKGGMVGNPDNKFSELEARHRIGGAVMANTLIGVVAALAWPSDDEPNPWFQILGSGPKEKGAKENWLSAGNQPYSLKFGNTLINYSETIVGPILGSLGNVFQEMKSENYDSKDTLKKFTLAMQGASGTILNMSFLRGLADVVGIATGDKDAEGTIANTLKGFVPYKGALSDVDKIFNGTNYDNKFHESKWFSGIPFIGDEFGKPSLNALGEEVERSFRFGGSKDPSPEMKYLTDNGVKLPALGTRYKILPANATKAEKAFGARTQAAREATVGRYYADTMTYDEVYEMVQISGPAIKKEIQKLQRMKVTGEKLDKEVDKIIQNERANAKMKILEKYLKN